MTHGPTLREIALALPCVALGAYALVFHLRDVLRVAVTAAETIRVAGL